MSIKIYQVDAFADRPFTGNPAAVCPLDGPRDADWMQSLAEEMNLSETAFWWPEGDVYRLRWFTPTDEVDLCGHATLASAHVAAEIGVLDDGETIRFQTRSGELTVARAGERYEMDFPALELKPDEPAPVGLAEALGLQDSDMLQAVRSRFDIIVELKDESAVRAVQPDFAKLKTVDARGVIVTAQAEAEDLDFVSRFFGPAVGVDEDPVTGSAHCSLTPFWAGKLEKTLMEAYQASKRGGHVQVELRGDRVLLRGQALTVFRGDLEV